MKIGFWMNYPSHHQKFFFNALRNAAIDIIICYYEKVPGERLIMGWSSPEKLGEKEFYLSEISEFTKIIPDWRERIHIITGYSHSFLRKIILKFSKSDIKWAHWSEPAHPGIRWFITFPIKFWMTNMINRYSLGAFAIGERALEDFKKWGVYPHKIALLPYSISALNNNAKADSRCESFIDRRQSFLYIGTLSHRKGIDILLKAFHKSSNNDWVLILVGNDRSNGGYSNLVKELGLTDRVLFRGPIDSSLTSSVIKCTDVLVLPSRFDGWGATLNEAASLGKALIGSDMVGSAYHLIEPGVNGFRIKANNVDSLAYAMTRYVIDHSLTSIHGQQSLRIFQNYRSEINVTRFINGLRSFGVNDM